MRMRSKGRAGVLALISGLLAPLGAGQSLPESPSIWREVTGVLDDGGPLEQDHDPRFQRPHLPAFRTSQDGRLAMTVARAPRFTLFTPEKLRRRGGGAPLMLQPPGEANLRWTGWAYVGGDPVTQAQILAAGTGREIIQSCFWDDELPIRTPAGRDRYQVKAVVTTRGPGGSLQLFMTPLAIEVAAPKTAGARIASIEVEGPTIAGPNFSELATGAFHSGGGFEPMVAGDGRLLVMRIRSADLPTPSGPGAADIVYSYYEDPAGTRGSANPAHWTEVFPISHAPHDPRLNGPMELGGFGFAQFPFRAPDGQVVPDWEDLGGAYPWIDRGARNLFYTTIGDTLHLQDPNPQFPNRDPQSAAEWTETRYEAVGVPGDPRERWGAESSRTFQGVAVAGLWTRGKTVLLDGLLNDMDFAIGHSEASSYGGAPYNVGPQQRLVRLFEGSGVPSLDPTSGWVRLGYGRASETPGLPSGVNGNSSVIESTESKLHIADRLRPLRLRDVVWHVQNGKHTDEVAFDDLLDPGALIVAEMNGRLTLPDLAGPGFNDLEHRSGWNPVTRAFDLPVHLQNAATDADRWRLPAFGELVATGGSTGRLEPAALGGVYGRGLWLEDGLSLRFDAPDRAGPGVPDPEAFYVGLFVDCRFADDGERRPLVTFPDGTSVELLGRSSLRYMKGDRVLHRVLLPDDFSYVPDGGQAPEVHGFFREGAWTHLGLRIERAGRRVTLLLDGFPMDRWQDPSRSIFQPLASAGAITVGGAAAAGATSLRGWVDEFKVLAHDVDPETAANHARGTLIGFDESAQSSRWMDQVAARFPEWAHGELSEALRRRGEPAEERYASFVDATRDLGVHRVSIPSGARHLRSAVHFPEGPVFQDRPRPDSSANRFCLSCHTAGAPGGLGLDALTYRPGLAALRDPRRQPSQPPARIGGAIPNGIVDAGGSPRPRPDEPRPVDGSPVLVDRWLLDRWDGRTAEVRAVSLMSGSGVIGALEADQELDPLRLGAGEVDLRVNLDVAQGDVELVLLDTGGPASVELHRRTAAHGPYRLFGPGVPAFDLQPGDYRLDATPAGGVTSSVPFTVAGGAPRTVATSADLFRQGSPSDGWFLRRNDLGDSLDPDEYVALTWDAAGRRYTGPTPADGWIASGVGSPGPGALEAAPGAHQGVVAAGYSVQRAGFYLVEGLASTQVAGAELIARVLHGRVAGGAPTTLFEQSLPAAGPPAVTSGPVWMEPGDVLWVVMAPGQTSVGDRFSWDFRVRGGDATWSQSFD